MTPLQELALVVSVIGGILAILMVVINLKVGAISKKQDDLCERIREEKTDRKESAQEKTANIKDLYDKVNYLLQMSVKSNERIETIIKTCSINHQWDHMERRGKYAEHNEG
jgi:hypothetical protein